MTTHGLLSSMLHFSNLEKITCKGTYILPIVTLSGIANPFREKSFAFTICEGIKIYNSSHNVLLPF